MSFNETAVIVLGLVAGYWVIDALLNKSPQASQQQGAPSQAGDKEEVYRSYIASNWFTILGVSETATQAEIDSAYQEMREQYHPEKIAHKGAEFRELAEFKMKQIQDAYDFAQTMRGTTLNA